MGFLKHLKVRHWDGKSLLDKVFVALMISSFVILAAGLLFVMGLAIYTAPVILVGLLTLLCASAGIATCVVLAVERQEYNRGKENWHV